MLGNCGSPFYAPYGHASARQYSCNMLSFPLCIFVSCNIYISKMNAVIPFETSCVCCRIWGLWVSGWEHFPSVFLLGWILLFPLFGWKCLPFVSVFFIDGNIYGFIFWMKTFTLHFSFRMEVSILVCGWNRLTLLLVLFWWKHLPFIVFVSGWKRFKSLVSLCGWKHLTLVFVFG